MGKPSSSKHPEKPKYPEEREREIRYLISNLIDLRDNFSLEVPNEIIHSGDYKVRKNWWQGVIAALAESQPYINSKEVKNDITDFLNLYMAKEFGDRLTTQEDIQIADALLTLVISTLEKDL